MIPLTCPCLYDDCFEFSSHLGLLLSLCPDDAAMPSKGPPTVPGPAPALDLSVAALSGVLSHAPPLFSSLVPAPERVRRYELALPSLASPSLCLASVAAPAVPLSFDLLPLAASALLLLLSLLRVSVVFAVGTPPSLAALR